MYVLIAILTLLLIFSGVREFVKDDQKEGTWQCSNAACGKYVNPQEWVAKNCAVTTLEDGSTGSVCSLDLNGVPTPVPLSAINLSFVAQQCEVVTCVQEVNVRVVNYTLPATP